MSSHTRNFPLSSQIQSPWQLLSRIMVADCYHQGLLGPWVGKWFKMLIFKVLGSLQNDSPFQIHIAQKLGIIIRYKYTGWEANPYARATRPITTCSTRRSPST